MDLFNQELFDNRLNPCLLNFSRLNKAYGFFTPKKWAKDDGTFTHEISLNPDLLLRPMQDIFSPPWFTRWSISGRRITARPPGSAITTRNGQPRWSQLA